MRRRARTGIGAALVGISLVLGTTGSATAAPPAPRHAETTQATAAAVTYVIFVRTHDVRYAGTDGDVAVRLHGSRGTSKFVNLNNAKNNFEQGKIDYFGVRLPNVGRLSSIDVRFRPAGVGPDWFLDWVMVRSAEYAEFSADRWLSTAQTVNIPRKRF